MAHHGQHGLPTSPPRPPHVARVHRAASTASSAPTTTPRRPAALPGAATDVVTLAAPRPDAERVTNEYVETPFRSTDSNNKSVVIGATKSRTSVVTAQPGARRHPPPPAATNNNSSSSKRPAPAAQTFKKDGGGGARGAGAAVGAGGGVGGAGAAGGGDCFRGSIICPECGRCRCESCRKPRPLPSRWLCGNACYCSPETAVDYLTCVCCVKGLFYHCCKEHEMEGGDHPCSCGPPRWAARWGCLCALSSLLPCLWCYWPLRGCLGALEACYRRHSTRGCRCQPQHSRLLMDASPDF